MKKILIFFVFLCIFSQITGKKYTRKYTGNEKAEYRQSTTILPADSSETSEETSDTATEDDSNGGNNGNDEGGNSNEGGGGRAIITSAAPAGGGGGGGAGGGGSATTQGPLRCTFPDHYCNPTANDLIKKVEDVTITSASHCLELCRR